MLINHNEPPFEKQYITVYFSTIMLLCTHSISEIYLYYVLQQRTYSAEHVKSIYLFDHIPIAKLRSQVTKHRCTKKESQFKIIFLLLYFQQAVVYWLTLWGIAKSRKPLVDYIFCQSYTIKEQHAFLTRYLIHTYYIQY